MEELVPCRAVSRIPSERDGLSHPTTLNQFGKQVPEPHHISIYENKTVFQFQERTARDQLLVLIEGYRASREKSTHSLTRLKQCLWSGKQHTHALASNATITKGSKSLLVSSPDLKLWKVNSPARSDDAAELSGEIRRSCGEIRRSCGAIRRSYGEIRLLCKGALRSITPIGEDVQRVPLFNIPLIPLISLEILVLLSFPSKSTRVKVSSSIYKTKP
ncbi:hypothetical protein YC2023_103965 [Brassica napus]